MIDVIKSIRRFSQYLYQDVLFFEWAIYFACFSVIGKTVGLSQELSSAYNGDRVYKILFLQHIFYKTDGVGGGIENLFDLGNCLGVGSK